MLQTHRLGTKGHSPAQYSFGGAAGSTIQLNDIGHVSHFFYRNKWTISLQIVLIFICSNSA